LNYSFDEDFLKAQRLRVAYHGRTTDAVVAVDETVESQPRAGPGMPARVN
jgi:hypothetical protein